MLRQPEETGSLMGAEGDKIHPDFTIVILLQANDPSGRMVHGGR